MLAYQMFGDVENTVETPNTTKQPRTVPTDR